ncbi:MAG: NUDIX hydrolase [Rhodobacteraceae bacterium]|nr:NUDIX hydrolase [Paracoccaceae bacterium]
MTKLGDDAAGGGGEGAAGAVAVGEVLAGTGAQVAALAWRERHGRIEVLMVTSRDTGRWVLPKGWPMRGRSPARSAAREAFEEAGATGRIGPVPVGSYGYVKRLGDGSGLPCRVTVYPLAVRRLHDDFPECRQRVRRWMRLREAAGLVAEAELSALLAAFAPDPPAAASEAPAGPG